MAHEDINLRNRVQEPDPFVDWRLPQFEICGTVGMFYVQYYSGADKSLALPTS
jgi:hypothetical protein